MTVIQIVGNNDFAGALGFCDNFRIRCAGETDIASVTTMMTALLQLRGQAAIYIHVEQEFHPATDAGIGNMLSSIAQEA